MIDLTDRVALVTGAGHGIGRATALTLAENNADVVVTDVTGDQDDVAAEIEAECDQEALALDMDVTDEDAVDAAVAEATDAFGRLDVLVNNAGIFPVSELDEMTREDWDHVLDVNLNGTFNCTSAVLPTMRDQQYGRIVNISSVSGGQIGWAGNLSHYAASKGGIVGFTRAAAIDLAPDNITMNAILPGMIDTGAAEEVSTDEQIQGLINVTPARRQGQPEEIGYAVTALADEHAGFITGAKLVVDGGITLV